MLEIILEMDFGCRVGDGSWREEDVSGDNDSDGVSAKASWR